MLNDNQHKGKEIHTRNMEIFTYEYDEKNIVVKGNLKEDILMPAGAGMPPLLNH